MLNPEHLADVVAPALPDAACRDHWELFDSTIAASKGNRSAELADARTKALAVCFQCPALQPCRRWLDTVPPSRRPSGVVASVLNTGRSPSVPW